MKTIIAVTGASGSIYARRILDKLEPYPKDIAVIFSEKAKQVWEFELGNRKFEHLPFKTYEPDNFFAPPASGSSRFDTMIICPCSMGTLSRIANGNADDLIARSADVMLKEKRKLILVTRESPLNLIHLRNMVQVTEAGAIVLPASPSFYSKPATLDDAVDTVIDRILQLAGYDFPAFHWGE